MRNILIGVLVGTDYNSGIKGIGPKNAIKLVKENKDDYQLRYEDNYFYLKKEELRK